MTTIEMLESVGYEKVRLLPTGEFAGLQRMIFTTGIALGLHETGNRTRFCFATYAEAEKSLAEWDGNGWPPGFWIKQKPEGIHGPGSTAKVRE